MTCHHCRAVEAHDAVERTLATIDSEYRKQVMTRSKAFWKRQMENTRCTCEEEPCAQSA